MADCDAQPLAKVMAEAHAAPRCGAKTRKRTPCRSPAMLNGRCRMHGGKSTGPRTPEGLERCRRANWKHGGRSQDAVAERKKAKVVRRKLARLTLEARGSN